MRLFSEQPAPLKINPCALIPSTGSRAAPFDRHFGKIAISTSTSSAQAQPTSSGQRSGQRPSTGSRAAPFDRHFGKIATSTSTSSAQAQPTSSGQRPSPSQQARGAAIGSRYGLAPFSKLRAAPFDRLRAAPYSTRATCGLSSETQWSVSKPAGLRLSNPPSPAGRGVRDVGNVQID